MNILKYKFNKKIQRSNVFQNLPFFFGILHNHNIMYMYHYYYIYKFKMLILFLT